MTITVLIRGTTGLLVRKCVHGQSLSQLSLLDDTGRLTKLINQAQLSRYLLKPRLKSLLARNLEYVLDLFCIRYVACRRCSDDRAWCSSLILRKTVVRGFHGDAGEPACNGQ
jgi:hypothetical protein